MESRRRRVSGAQALRECCMIVVVAVGLELGIQEAAVVAVDSLLGAAAEPAPPAPSSQNLVVSAAEQEVALVAGSAAVHIRVQLHTSPHYNHLLLLHLVDWVVPNSLV